jgi:ABC-2 type transport system permease protein
MPYFNFSQFPLFPSYWLSEGILTFSFGNKTDFIFYCLLILSNAMFLVLVSQQIAEKFYYQTWSNLESTSWKKTYQNRIGKIYDYLLRPFSRPVRALIEKDTLTFLREPAFWLQFFIFFGLLAVYFGNIQNLSYHMVKGKWKNLIAFLNFSATNLTLASLCVRFIFPQMSLESQRYWIVGLAPIKFRKVLFQKFWQSSIICLIITEGLIIFSNLMLEVPLYILAIFVMLTFLSCFALVGLSSGLGAKFIRFEEENISQIVSGFAGTLNLILSLMYIGFVVIFLSAPLHLYFTQRITQAILVRSLTISAILVFLVSILISVVPLYIGVKSLAKQEF